MIPIYRGLKSGTENEYVEGQYLVYKGYPTIFDEYGLNGIEIDKTTLSIHFSDILDSQGNKIFASLQEDGKGGDVCSVNDYIDSGLKGVAIYQNYGFRIDRKGKAMGISLSSTDIKIIGIQQ